MIMLKAVNVRLYPTQEQRNHLAQSFGCARWYWNYSLALTQKTYSETGKGLSRGAIQGLLPNLKKEFEWLKEPYSQCLQVVALNLSHAFINFFEGRGKFPQFKCKGNKQSISYPQDEALRLLALGRRATAHGGTVSQGSGREKSTTELVPMK